MKRRTFGKLTGSSALVLTSHQIANAQTAPASSLGAGLTPMGSEQAGNADGSIPPWTGGMTTVPPGRSPNDYVPEMFPDEQPVLVIDASNMAQHASMLSEGTMTMMTKYGFSMKVYPTHRTAALPQWVYDNIAKNATTAKFVEQDPVGGRFGFEGAFGGYAFPVPDVANPLAAGAQIMWNHLMAWAGYCFSIKNVASYSAANGQLALASITTATYKYPYYNPNGRPADYDGSFVYIIAADTGPQDLVGQEIIVKDNINPYKHPRQAWELLNGEGRVRRAPEIAFDTPNSLQNGITNYDEVTGFSGSLERYDWKYLGKQEMYIPYNNNKMWGLDSADFMKAHFFDPDVVRWEKHRCWVVEATLHPGERNVLARRRFYIDEDTWRVSVTDAYDGNNNLYKVQFVYNYCRPDAPGLVFANACTHNLQTNDYAEEGQPNNQGVHSTLDFSDLPDSLFDPANMAAAAQY